LGFYQWNKKNKEFSASDRELREGTRILKEMRNDMIGYEYREMVIAFGIDRRWWILNNIDSILPISPNPYSHAYLAERYIDEFYRVEHYDRTYLQEK